MRQIIALILSCCLLFSGCSTGTEPEPVSENERLSSVKVVVSSETVSSEPLESVAASLDDFQTVLPEYNSLSDPDLIQCVEDSVYAELVENLEGDYFVEDVSAVYVSKEYLEEVSYNSQENIFFGHTLAGLDEQFQGTRYVFTLGDNGETTVEPFEEYDDTYERAIKNAVIGTGVILLCVTVSAVSGGLGAPAVSIVFAASAKTGSIMALSSGGLGAVGSAVIIGIQTKDFEKTLKAAALNGSEGFKWGAISGALSGGVGGARQVNALNKANVTSNGLTLKEATKIQNESKYPLDVIKEFKSIEQYNICKEAHLSTQMINGKTALIRNIDLNFTDELGRTNLERMQDGLAALDPVTGDAYQLHHIGQRADSTLAILTRAEHTQGGNHTIWHELAKETQVHGAGSNWDAQRQAFWKAMAAALS